MNEIELRAQLIELLTRATNEMGGLDTQYVIDIIRDFTMTNNLYPEDVIMMMSRFCDEHLKLPNGFFCARGQSVTFNFDEYYLMKNLERVHCENESKQLSHNEKEEI